MSALPVPSKNGWHRGGIVSNSSDNRDCRKQIRFLCSNRESAQQPSNAFPVCPRRSLLEATILSAIGIFPGNASLAVEVENVANEILPKEPMPLTPPVLPAYVESWEKVRGDGYLLKLPPGFKNLTEEIAEKVQEQSYLGDQKTPQLPFLGQYVLPETTQVVTVVSKKGSSLKLSFLEVTDATDFGSPVEASDIFIPEGGRLAATRQFVNAIPGLPPRTYYLYEFVFEDRRFVLSAVVANGMVFVLGASASREEWPQVAQTMRAIAKTFTLVA